VLQHDPVPVYPGAWLRQADGSGLAGIGALLNAAVANISACYRHLLRSGRGLEHFEHRGVVSTAARHADAPEHRLERVLVQHAHPHDE